MAPERVEGVHQQLRGGSPSKLELCECVRGTHRGDVLCVSGRLVLLRIYTTTCLIYFDRREGENSTFSSELASDTKAHGELEATMMHLFQSGNNSGSSSGGFFRSSGRKKQSGEIFYVRSLRRMQKLVKRNSGLYKSMDKCLSTLSEQSSASSVNEELRSHPNTYVSPLLDACSTQKPQLMDISIDTLQKLISYQIINSHTPCAEDPNSPLVNKVIGTICTSMAVDFHDENIQLQVIKALLQAVTMCNIHGKTLRLIIKTCFNIHLISRNPDNRRAAQGTLNQMLNVIFQKMETKEKKHETSQFTVDEDDNDEGLAHEDASTALSATPSSALPTHSHDMIPDHLFISHLVRSAMDTVVERHRPDDDTASNYSHSTTQSASNQAHTSTHDQHISHPSASAAHRHHHHRFDTQFQKDAYNIFKALCALSQRPLPPNPLPESIELRSRILSLDLIHSILDSSGPYFRSNDSFLRSIQKHLCNSLLKNCVSNIPSVFNLSLKIFQTLVRNFKEQMTTQIGIFLSSAVLRILESENSSYKHKMLVIDVLQTISDDPQNLVDIFVNFDCQLKSLNLFETLVTDLSKVVLHSYAEAHWVTAEQEYKLKRAALRVILKIVNAIEERMNSPPAAQAPLDGAADSTTSADHGTVSTASDQDGTAQLSSDHQRTASLHTRTDSTTTVGSVSSPVVDFARIKQEKITMKEAIDTFNEKPPKGIKMLIQHGIIEDSPESIAHFLLNNKEISKQKIGEFIGSENQKEVLHQFAFMQDFSNKDFMTAFRQYLTTFRLPGEGQQIDRVVQKFAQRYYQDNPTKCFASADAAYVFAYAVIMLQTELHNPAFGNRERMTIEGFIENNKECNDGGDFPEEFQREVYENVRQNEIKLRADTDTVGAASAAGGTNAEVAMQNMTLEMKKQHLFDLEGKRIMKQTRKAIKWSNSHNSEFYVVTDPKYAKPMFEVIWQDVLSALAFVFSNFDSSSELKYCIQGFDQCIRISTNEHWTLQRARNAFMAKLAEQCHMATIQEIASLQQKHVDCLKLLLQIAQNIPDYLGSSWKSVLEIYSRLEELQQESLGNRQNGDTFANPTSGSTSSSGSSTPTANQASSSAAERAVADQKLQSLFHQIDFESTEKTFIKSSELSDESIVTFVQMLCQISDKELQNNRDYSLKKLITVAHFNLNRIKIVWNRLWNPMASHFVSVACHSDQQMAMNAIVSLRQLATKFFEQGELENFHFQANFLRPFMEIIKRSDNPHMRELIVECVGNMIQLRYHNIKSGWKSIMQIFTEASKDDQAEVVRAAHNNVALVMKQYFPHAQFAFVDVVNCLVALCSSKHNSEWSLSNIEHIQTCAEYLAEGRLYYFSREKREQEESNGDQEQNDTAVSASAMDLAVKVEKPSFTDAHDDTNLWWPILTGLSRLINDERVLIRAKALEVLFQKIFKLYGDQFSADLWKLIFKGVIVPIFDDIQHTKDVDQHTEWITTSCHKALSLLVEIFVQYFSTVHEVWLSSLLKLLKSCVRKESDRLSNIGHECILQLVTECWEKFDDSHWTQITSAYASLFERSDINQLDLEAAELSIVGTYIRNNAATQLNLTDAIRTILTKRQSNMSLDIEMSFIQVLSKALSSIQSIATSTRLSEDAAIKLGAQDILRLDQALSITYLERLLQMFADSASPERQKRIEKDLIQTFQHMIQVYMRDSELSVRSDVQGSAQHVKNSVPVVSFVLKGFSNLRDDQFARYAPQFKLSLCNLIMSPHATVRDALRTVFYRLTQVQVDS